jgi:hypothetical protein
MVGDRFDTANSAASHSDERRREAAHPPGGAAISVLRAPFALRTWKRTAYALLALPLTVVSVVLSVLGRGRTGRVLHARACRTFLDVELGLRPHSQPWARAGYALLGLPLNAAALFITVYLWAATIGNIAYPLRPDSGDLATAWGGPTLAGAWAVHGSGGLVFLFVTPWIIFGLTWLQAALARRAFGA